jgi:hypothetical protein
MAALIFGSLKYQEVARLSRRLKKAKTKEDRTRLYAAIEFLKAEIRKEEATAAEYFEKM